MNQKMKRASEIFGSVDPHLNVIDRGHRRRPVHPLTSKDWESAGGSFCSRCRQEALRFRPFDGVCLDCVRDIDEKKDREDKKRAKILKYVKAHNARIRR